MIGFILAILLAALSAVSIRVLFKLEFFKSIKSLRSFNRLKPRVLAGTDKLAPSVEDFRFISENIVLLGKGCVLENLHNGDAAPENGAIVAVDMTTEVAITVDRHSFPNEIAFRPHGIEFSSKTNRLYVVNHANNGEERLDIFSVEGKESLDTLKLTWKDCIHPPVPAGSTNAVTEASERDIYFTYWLPFPVPKQGLDRPNGLIDTLCVVGNYGVNLLGKVMGLEPFKYGFTSVMRCDLEAKRCEVAFPKFTSCNGIASSPDGTLLFVVDCFCQYLAVLNRDPVSGKLSRRKEFFLPHGADNVTCHQLRSGNQYELWMGTVPDTWNYLLEGIKKDKRLVPGGFLSAVYDADKNEMSFQDVLIHDGSVLPAVATAGRWKNKILMSGPRKTGGVLVFDEE